MKHIPDAAIRAAAEAIDQLTLPCGISFSEAVNERIARAALKAAAPHMAPPPEPAPDTESGQLELFTIPGTAEYLGCSEMHVYRLIEAGELRIVDIAVPGSRRSKTRIRAEDLADFLDRRTR
jgi:excisionase family DNA binding protein